MQARMRTINRGALDVDGSGRLRQAW